MVSCCRKLSVMTKQRAFAFSVCLFWILAAIVYWPLRKAGFVTDYTGLLWRIETHGAKGILTSFGFPSLQPLLNTGNYLAYRVFGASGAGWSVLFFSLHALNAGLLAALVWRLQHKTMYWAGLAVGLIFLLHPYQTEVLVWRVCLNYLLSTGFIFSSLHLGISWSRTQQKPLAIGSLVCMTCGMLCFEFTLITPFLFTVYTLLFSDAKRKKWVLPVLQFLLIPVYFIVHKLVTGLWIGHYGASTHANFPVLDMLSNWNRYVLKFAIFSRDLPHELKSKIPVLTSSPVGGIALAVFWIGLLVYAWLQHRKGKTTWTWILWGVSGSGLGCLLVLNLYFTDLLHIQNDRHGYLFSAFFAMLLVSAHQALPRLTGAIVSLYLVASVWLLVQHRSYWQQSTDVYWGLLNSFYAEPDEDVLLLNLPDNLQGAPLFRSYAEPDVSFSDALTYVLQKPPGYRLHTVANYNLVSSQDAVQVNWLETEKSLKVEFMQYGNWWWYKGLGALEYQNTRYLFNPKPDHYLLTLKPGFSPTRIYYQSGIGWLPFTIPYNSQ